MKIDFKMLVSAAMLCCFSQIGAQTQTSDYWEKSTEPAAPTAGTRVIVPTTYLNVRLNLGNLKSQLQHARLKNDPSNVPVLISLPHPDGKFYEYRVYLNTTMHPDLAARYPEIRSYDAVATNGSGNTVKLDLTPQGFHAMILSPNASTVFIDPYVFRGDLEQYMVYSKSDFKTTKEFHCANATVENTIDVGQEELTPKAFGTCELRTYRVAISATGEYTTFHGGTIALAQAAQVTTMNRVNGIYERDMSITMVLIPNNDVLIHTNASTDPFTNGTPNSMITQNQTAINGAIGSSNYDIGHVFGTNSGGLAGLGVVCGNQKARGVTGSAAPIGDPFDIDYVAHEMGHQFSGNHSFNNSCNGNRNNSTAVEPGSGSTIMAYAGICGPNVQSNSDDHFHGRNLQEIGNFITGSSHTCPVKTPLTNSAPTITGTVGNVTIPANTPFALTATATDPDGDQLTYCWEQMNNQTSTQPPVATATGGPNFRSNSPVASPTRYFPSISSLMAGGPFTWEKLPSVTRTMNFRVVVRDNALGGGCNDHEDITISTTSTAGPFVVNYPSNVGINWSVGATKTVTWSVANTDVAPVACANVNIMLSIDGGVTFTTLLANTPNDGSAPVVVPNTVTTNAIVMVICSNGTFFDISDNKFSIITGPSCDGATVPTVTISNQICPEGGTSTMTIATGDLNDAADWHWYSGSCGGTLVGTGTSVTVGTAGIYYVRGEGGCVTTPGTCRSSNVQTASIITTVVVNSTQMTANQASSTYQWINCEGNTPIAGATGKSYTATENGSYAVIITKSNCSDTSDCIAITTAGLEDLNALDIQVYPNPVNEILTVEFGQLLSLENITVTDALGRTVQQFKGIHSTNMQIDLGNESAGVYFLNLRMAEQFKTWKVIKQ